MPQEFLNHPQISPTLQKMGSKCMSQRVRTYMPLNRPPPCILIYNIPSTPRCQPSSSRIQKKRLRNPPPPPFSKGGMGGIIASMLLHLVQVFPNSLTRLTPKRNYSLLPPFTKYPYIPPLQIHISHI